MWSHFSTTPNRTLEYIDIPHTSSIGACDTFGILIDTASLTKHEAGAGAGDEAVALNLEEIKLLRGKPILWITDLMLLKQ